MPRFEFVIRLAGEGENKERAYERALEGLVTDPGDPETVVQLDESGKPLGEPRPY